MFRNQDLNKARYGVFERVRNTAFQQPWQWALEIKQTGKGGREINPPPQDFAVYVKDISYGAIEIETETKNVGGAVVTLPVRLQPVTLSMTVRDNQAGDVFRFFQAWAGQVINDDGTINVAQSYRRTCTRYQLTEDARGQLQKKESAGRVWQMFPTMVGDITESVEDRTGLLEFPVTCVQLYSLG